MPKSSQQNQQKTMGKAQETILEIDLKALAHNYTFLKSKLSYSTKFMAVVKAFGYGSDAIVIAKKLEELGADYLAVAFTDEGVSLRDAGIRLPVLVLHPQPIHFKTIIERCLEPNLYSLSVLNEFIKIAEEENQSDYPIHIEFNTGLNRLGLKSNTVDEIVNTLSKTKAVKIKSAFSHMVASEDLNEKTFTRQQINEYKETVYSLENKLDYSVCKHMCNTSGVLNYLEAHFDMVRCGIGLYGFGNSSSYNKQLKPIAKLKSVISQIHTLQVGESLGYNRAFVAEKVTRTATIPIGHADGIGRQYGNGKGYVFINGEKALIAGNVCMDMLMVDVTNISCEKGDEVIIFDEKHSADNLANSANTISYEIITAISQRIKRVIIE